VTSVAPSCVVAVEKLGSRPVGLPSCVAEVKSLPGVAECGRKSIADDARFV